jgi:AraC-like DNA-binding protein
MIAAPSFGRALRGCRLFESDDLDETRELISRVMQPHALIPTGREPGVAHMDFAKVGKLGLGTIAFGDAMHVDVEFVDDYYLMMFCVRGTAEVRSLGRTVRVDRDNAVLCAPGQPFDALLSPDCEQFVLRIDPDTFTSHMGPRAQSLPSRVPVGSVALRGWQQQLQLLTGSEQILTYARENPVIGTQFEGLLMELLVAGLDEVRQGARPASLSPGFVKRAEDFMQANFGGQLQLADVALAVGVPERTLLDGFQRFKGVSPIQYLRTVRLEHARQALRDGPAHARVAEVALACGFAHLGRFSIAYREQFGELPSDTLRNR